MKIYTNFNFELQYRWKKQYTVVFERILFVIYAICKWLKDSASMLIKCQIFQLVFVVNCI